MVNSRGSQHHIEDQVLSWSEYKGMIRPLFQRHRNMILYFVIGGCCATSDFLIFSGLIIASEIHMQVANAIGYASGTFLSFCFNFFFNWRLSDQFFRRLLMFSIVGLAGLLLSSLLLGVLVNSLGVVSFFAKVITIFMVAVFQYLMNKNISFRTTK